MVWYTFGPFVAYDPAQSGAAKLATFTVYDENDTSNSTPLATTNPAGLSVPVTSDADGLITPFRVEDHPAVKVVSGGYSIPAYSVKDMRDVTLAAAASAATSASAAQAAQVAAETAAANTGGGGGGGVTDHGLLSGLADDDHAQYHNDTRGDARYYRKAEVDTAVNNAASQNSAADRNRANHTGTQPLSSLATTGTASATTFLRGDGTWATPAGGGGGGLTAPVALTDVSFSAVGAQVAGAASKGAARTAIDAGTSNLATGGTLGAAATAMRSDALLINPSSVPGTGTYLIARTS